MFQPLLIVLIIKKKKKNLVLIVAMVTNTSARICCCGKRVWILWTFPVVFPWKDFEQGSLVATLPTQLEGTVKLEGKQCEMKGKKHSCLNKQAGRAVELVALLETRALFVEFKTLSSTLRRWKHTHLVRIQIPVFSTGSTELPFMTQANSLIWKEGSKGRRSDSLEFPSS